MRLNLTRYSHKFVIYDFVINGFNQMYVYLKVHYRNKTQSVENAFKKVRTLQTLIYIKSCNSRAFN